MKQKHNSSESCGGFALVIALGLMAFILLLSLSITTLTRVETQSAQAALTRVEAEQNALLGLQQALGVLQGTLGPDQRVSATAEILPGTDPSRKQLTGAWVSDPGGVNIGGRTYSEGDLLRWLVSDFEGIADNETAAPNADVIKLVGAGSLADSNQDGIADDPNAEVAVGLSRIGGSQSSGNFAWWIGDEGVKARINMRDASQNPALSPNGRKQAALQTLKSSARSVVALLADLSGVNLQTDSLAEKLLYLAELSLAASAPADDVVKAYFHDLTTYSRGVLSDVRGGGLKRDLSLAFEMPDDAFDRSVFGSGGPDTINSIGFGRVQPIFRLPNSTGVDANGPTWHLLRDYYTLYQRIDSPMTNPTLDAQAFTPNRVELNPGNSVEDWAELAAMRYVSSENNFPNAQNLQSQGDPLRVNGGELPVPVKANYLPYVQRNLVRLGLDFEAAPVPEDYSNTNNYEFRKMRQLINPAFVVHNPYNVRLRHDGMITAVDTLRFRVEVESLLDSEFDTTQNTALLQHALRLPPGDIEAGAVRVYAGVEHKNTPSYSQPGSGSRFWDPGSLASIADIVIPVDPAAGGPNLRVFYRPFDNNQWAQWMYHSIAVPGVDTPVAANANGDTVRYNRRYSNYGGLRSRVRTTPAYQDWYGGADINGRPVNSENYRVEDDAIPFPYLNYDLFVKPAEAGPANRFVYPGLTHTNPLAPITQSTNLFPTGFSKPDYGWPMYAPNWQLNIYTRENVPGLDVLETNGDYAFWGASNTLGGSTRVAGIELPTSPPLSLGQLQNANVSLYAHMPALAIANSFASPYVPLDSVYRIYQNQSDNPRIFYDLSYLCNEALWDRYFFSSYARAYDPGADAYNGSVEDSFDNAFDPGSASSGSNLDSLPNPRAELHLPEESIADVKAKLFNASGDPLEGAYERAAENLLMKGSFNLHSTSVNAWKVMLASARNLSVYQSGDTSETNYANNRTPMTRIRQPIDGAFDTASGHYADPEAWGGFSTLSDPQLDALANAIVNELKQRVADEGAVFTSLSSFINRRLAEGDFGLAGLLQAAIDQSGINSGFVGANLSVDAGDLQTPAGDFPFPDSILDGDSQARSTATTATGHLTQGDLLQAIGSFVSVRSDTFRVRAYGEAVDPVTREPIGSAWCEAIVQRVPEPVTPGAADPGDPDYWEVPAQSPFGRQFKIIHFRWLNEDEV